MHNRSTIIGLGLAAILAIPLPAGASDEGEYRQPTPTPPPQSGLDDLQLVRPGGRQGLLREGSHLLQAAGRFVQEPETQAWRFVVQPPHEGAAAYVLTALPSSFLGEAEQVMEVSREQGLVFEVSGEVLVYQGRNYLLLTSPARVIGHEAEIQPPSEPEPAQPDAAETDPDGRADEGDSGQEQPSDEPAARGPRDAASIMRDLEQQTGPVQRRSPTTADRAADSDMDSQVATLDEHLLREGTSIVMRRGRLSRDASGSWLFVFDADASGMADPPMTLLPCLLLERLERHYQVAGTSPIQLTGRVLLYEGRNYLLPTVYQVPRERDIVTPSS